MEYTHIRYSEFIKGKKCLYPSTLPVHIREKIRVFRTQLEDYEKHLKNNDIHHHCYQALKALDISIEKAIREHLVQKVAAKANTDIQICKALLHIGWTRKIWKQELVAMGMQHPLSCHTLIVGKYKLTCANDTLPVYDLIPLGTSLRKISIKDAMIIKATQTDTIQRLNPS